MWYIAALAIALLPVLFVTWRYIHWKMRCVPHLTPVFPTGNLRGFATNLHLSEVLQKLYEQLKGKGPIGGIYSFLAPQVLALDLDLVKRILVNDFNHFHDRSLYVNEKDDPLSGHLINLEGIRWKKMRSKLTGAFTSIKIKMMYPVVGEIAANLDKCITKAIQSGKEVELQDILARFSTDVIGSCIFGMEINSLENPNAQFLEMGRRSFKSTPFTILKVFLAQQIRPLARMCGVTIFERDATEYFIHTMKNIVDYREKNKVERNDFIDLLIKMKNAELPEDKTKNSMEKLTLEEISAQAFLFFFAGFQISSTLVSFCLYELAKNQELQQKARQNVLDAIKQHGLLSHETANSMKYLENCILESIRLHPPVPTIFRTATQNYRVPNTELVIEQGTMVNIPVLAIHRDPQYYPDPLKFDPDRFLPEQVAKRHQMAFIPFGDGPRTCIGKRFGTMVALVGLATLLTKFRFTVAPKTRTPIKIMPSSAVITSADGVWLNVEAIDA